MATKYNTIVKSVTAIQFTFDVLKELYLFLGMKDIQFIIKDRTLTSIITLDDNSKKTISKNDYVVKYSDGRIETYKPEEFKKIFVEVATTSTKEV